MPGNYGGKKKSFPLAIKSLIRAATCNKTPSSRTDQTLYLYLGSSASSTLGTNNSVRRNIWLRAAFFKSVYPWTQKAVFHLNDPLVFLTDIPGCKKVCGEELVPKEAKVLLSQTMDPGKIQALSVKEDME